MRCHFCTREAAYAPESEGMRVGLCEAHLRQFVSTCQQRDLPTAFASLA